MKKPSKSYIYFGFICTNCKEGKQVHGKPEWNTRLKRNKDMEKHTKKTGHNSFYRNVSEFVK